jgi:hypothetical protein
VPVVSPQGPGGLRNGRPSSNESGASWRWFELRRFADVANAQAQSRAAPRFKGRFRIVPRFDQQAAQRQYRCGTAHCHSKCGAAFRTDQLGANGLRIFNWEAISPNDSAAKLG